MRPKRSARDGCASRMKARKLVAEIAGQGIAILDCCAAPGGKTLVLAERNPQAHIVACDASPERLGRLRDRLAFLGARVECKLADAAALVYENEFDLVLADVPCSGTGTLGRNPEIRHRLRVDDIARHSERQRAILAGALRAARNGGRVVYSTCSLESEENEDVVAAVLRDDAHASIVPMQARIDEMDQRGILTPGAGDRLKTCVTPEGFLRLFPGALGTDGFFVAVMEKSNEARALLRRQPQRRIIAAQQSAQRLHHQLVIFAHGQSGNGDAAHHARACNGERKRPAMRGIVGERQALALGKGDAFHLLANTDGIGTAMEPRHHIALAPHPFRVVRRGAVHRRVKQWLTEPAHVDHDREAALMRHGAQTRPQVPRNFGIQPRKHQLSFLLRNAL